MTAGIDKPAQHAIGIPCDDNWFFAHVRRYEVTTPWKLRHMTQE
jgi:hypothetical protein